MDMEGEAAQAAKEISLNKEDSIAEVKGKRPRSDSEEDESSDGEEDCLSEDSQEDERRRKMWSTDPVAGKKFEKMTSDQYDVERGIWLAEKAVEYYNTKHGGKYVLENVKCSSATWMWNHVNYIACTDDPDSSPQLFFAEVFGNPCTYYCSLVCPIDPTDPTIKRGCTLCPRECLHPDRDDYNFAGEAGSAMIVGDF